MQTIGELTIALENGEIVIRDDTYKYVNIPVRDIPNVITTLLRLIGPDVQEQIAILRGKLANANNAEGERT